MDAVQTKSLPLNRFTSPPSVSLVIPGRNAESTVRACLEAVVGQLGRAGLEEILFVDDGSTDRTRNIVGEYPVRLLPAPGEGAAAARNRGWRAACGSLVWFLDADCVAEPDALVRLLPHLAEADVGGAGGSYANARPDKLLACLIHEEIVARHRRMAAEVSVLATYNVVYRRRVLAELSGFDPSFAWAHDAELAFRVRRAGYRLRFEPGSRVAHYHPVRWRSYLDKQRQQGYWRMMLYRRHPARMAGDSYSGVVDFVQPPLALITLATLPALLWPAWRWLPVCSAGALLALQIPMTARIVRHSGVARHVSFAALGFVRAFCRAAGMLQGIVAAGTGRPRSSRAAATGLGSGQGREVPPDRPGGQSDPAAVAAAAAAGPAAAPQGQSSGGAAEPARAAGPLPPRVSVVIATCNRAVPLRKCLESLAAQSFDRYEVIVVDDGSRDDTPAQLAEMARRHSAMRLSVVVNETNQGANPSRNRAIRRARGELVAFIDDDCIADRAWLEHLVEPFGDDRVAAVTGTVQSAAPRNLYDLTLKGTQRVAGRRRASRLVGCNMCVRRRVLRQHMLDEDRADAASPNGPGPDMSVSGRGDEEGLFIEIGRAGYEQLLAAEARVLHVHHHGRSSFFKQAYRSGQAAARLVYKYCLPPRLDMLPFLLAYATTPLGLWGRPWSAVPLCFFAAAVAAILYNDLVRKRKTVWETLVTFPLLLSYYHVRLAGYVCEGLRLRLVKHGVRRGEG